MVIVIATNWLHRIQCKYNSICECNNETKSICDKQIAVAIVPCEWTLEAPSKDSCMEYNVSTIQFAYAITSNHRKTGVNEVLI